VPPLPSLLTGRERPLEMTPGPTGRDATCAPQKVRPPRERGFFPSGALPCPAKQIGKPRATVITFLHLLRDLVLAFAAPRTTLVAENLLLRQQVVVLSRQSSDRACAPSTDGCSRPWPGGSATCSPPSSSLGPRPSSGGTEPAGDCSGAGDCVGPVAVLLSTWIFATSSAACGVTTQPGART